MSQIKETYERVIPARFRVFLDEKGMTMSAANHQANMVKEKMAETASVLDKTNGFTSVVDVKGKNVKLDNFVKVDDLKAETLREGFYYGLSAWLREAIKAKQIVLDLIQGVSLDNLRSPDAEVLTFPDTKQPVLAQIQLVPFTLEDAIDELSVKERQEYLSVEAQAAHLGKKIHEVKKSNPTFEQRRAGAIATEAKVGKIKEMRDQLNNFQENTLIEYSLGGSSREVCIVTHTPLYSAESLNTLYLELQEQHRSYEERLNYYKGRLKDRISEVEIERMETYRSAVAQASLVWQEEMRAYNTLQNEFQIKQTNERKELEKLRLEVSKYIAKLKIIIPDNLKTVSEEISALTKESE